MRYAPAVLLTCVTVLLPVGPAAQADVRDDYERSLRAAPRELAPPALLGHVWQGTGTGTSGDAVVSRGELVLEDRPFDDTGADTRPGNGPAVQTGVAAATLSGLCGPASAYSTGDMSYPTGEAHGPRNSADLVQVRLAVRGQTVHVFWQLQTVVDPATVAVALLVDTDSDASSGTSLQRMGFEVGLVVTSSGAVGVEGARSAVDAAANTVEASFPRGALPAGPWRVQALAGLREGDGLGALADLGHVPDEPVLDAPACKLDAVQSRLLAGGPLPAVAVDPGRLARRESDRVPLRRGLTTRTYVPEEPLGEGVVGQMRYGQTSSASVYRGTGQPYSLYVPASYDPARPAPVLLLLHCLTCWHTVYGQSEFAGIARLAEEQGLLVATPFGLGEGGHYEGEAERDAFAVLSDVSRRYAVDQERLLLSGMSMGSLGTFRLGLSHPDLWARLLAVAPYTTPFCVTPAPATVDCGVAFNYLTTFPNARNVPVGLVVGTADELTPATGARYFADELTRLGYRFRSWEYALRTHDPRLHGLTTDVTGPFLAGARRERSPSQVSYVVDRAMHREGALPDQAYWLSGLRMADDVPQARVDAESGRGVGYGTVAVRGSGDGLAGPWSLRGLDGVPAVASGRNELSLQLTGFTAATVDLPGARLTRDEPLPLTVEADRPVVVRLADEVLALPAGRSSVVLPARSRAGGAPVASEQLPATGAGATWVAALLLAAGLTVSVRRARVQT